MSEENQNQQAQPNISLPKFDLPKAAAPTIRMGNENTVEQKTNSFSNPRPADFGGLAAVDKEENPALVAVDAICAVVAVAFAILMFLER